MAKSKVVFAYMGGVRKKAVFVPDMNKTVICSLCETELKIGKNKFDCEMAIEWCREYGWVCHQKACKGFNMKKIINGNDIGFHIE